MTICWGIYNVELFQAKKIEEQNNCGKFLTPNKLKEIFEYCSECELNIIRLKPLELSTFNLGVPLRKTDVN